MIWPRIAQQVSGQSRLYDPPLLEHARTRQSPWQFAQSAHLHRAPGDPAYSDAHCTTVSLGTRQYKFMTHTGRMCTTEQRPLRSDMQGLPACLYR